MLLRTLHCYFVSPRTYDWRGFHWVDGTRAYTAVMASAPTRFANTSQLNRVMLIEVPAWYLLPKIWPRGVWNGIRTVISSDNEGLTIYRNVMPCDCWDSSWAQDIGKDWTPFPLPWNGGGKICHPFTHRQACCTTNTQPVQFVPGLPCREAGSHGPLSTILTNLRLWEYLLTFQLSIRKRLTQAHNKY